MTPEFKKSMKNFIKTKKRMRTIDMNKQLAAYGIIINGKNYLLKGRKKPKKFSIRKDIKCT